MNTHLTLAPAALLLLAAWSTGVSAGDGAPPGKPAGQCTSVQANQPWQGTGITVSPSEFVCVAAAGLWSHGGQGIQAMTPFYGPEGFAKDDPVNIPEVVSRVGALVGRIGANAPFVVERQLCFIPAASGELMLSMNDDPGAFANNVGAMSVQVVKLPASSIPRRVQLQPHECRVR